MKDSFNYVVNYLEELIINKDNENISDEERMVTIIKHAILTDKFYSGSIIFTKKNDEYIVSSIQKHSYGWLLKNKKINMNEIIDRLNELKITYSFDYYPISNHQNDFELSFCVPKLNNVKKKTRIKM